MNNNFWHKLTTTVLTTVFGVATSFLISTPKTNASTPVENLNTNQSIENPPEVATTSPNLTLPIPPIRLYNHQVKGKEVTTLHFQDFPLVTFKGNNVERVSRAREAAQRLQKLLDNNIDGRQITLKWNTKERFYSIKEGEEELFRMDKTTVLPDSTGNLTNDALQATNRLRRLLGNAPPLKFRQGVFADEDQANVNFTTIRTAGNGIASWYGPGFHGRRTASGEQFNQYDLTAAHLSLPFGTKVRVTNAYNGRSVIVRINDRGPHIRGRIIDLSAGAAQLIGLFSSGTAPVMLEVLGY